MGFAAASATAVTDVSASGDALAGGTGDIAERIVKAVGCLLLPGVAVGAQCVALFTQRDIKKRIRKQFRQLPQNVVIRWLASNRVLIREPFFADAIQL